MHTRTSSWAAPQRQDWRDQRRRRRGWEVTPPGSIWVCFFLSILFILLMFIYKETTCTVASITTLALATKTTPGTGLEPLVYLLSFFRHFTTRKAPVFFSSISFCFINEIMYTYLAITTGRHMKGRAWGQRMTHRHHHATASPRPEVSTGQHVERMMMKDDIIVDKVVFFFSFYLFILMQPLLDSSHSTLLLEDLWIYASQ
jgi:hypothetical protein